MDCNCQRMGFSNLLLLLLLLGKVIGDRVQIMSVPDKSKTTWKWSWTPSGTQTMWDHGTLLVGSQTKIYYHACQVASSGQPNTWLRSDIIDVQHARRIYITIDYAVQNCSAIVNAQHCKHNFDLYAHQASNIYTPDKIPDPYLTSSSREGSSIYEKVGSLNPKVISYPKLRYAQNFETHSFKMKPGNNYVYLALHYKGGCFVVYGIHVHYYRCPLMALSSSLIQLPTTTSPADGSVQVNGSCTQHAQPMVNADDLYGYCKADGKWSKDSNRRGCLCEAGYEEISVNRLGSECKVCPSGTYRSTVSNTSCSPCPANSRHVNDRTRCTCKPGFFRSESEAVYYNCTKPPLAPRELVTMFINATFVTMKWSLPSDLGGRSDLYYQVECKSCNDAGNDCTRECSPKVKIYLKELTNVSTLANVKQLSAYKYYKLRVFAKNGVSQVAEKNKKTASFSEIVLRTNETIPGIPEIIVAKALSSSSVFLNWKVQEKNGVIIYYEVSYYPVEQPSKLKILNTTFSNTTINGLKKGNEYFFQVRAGSTFGLGRPSKRVDQFLSTGKINTIRIPEIIVAKAVSSSSVFLSWNVQEKNGVIIYYQVSYYPVDQPSKLKILNTTSTNATINSLKEGNGYFFQVRAATKLGLGQPSKTVEQFLPPGKIYTIPFSWEILAGIVGAAGVFLILILILVIVCLHRKRRRYLRTRAFRMEKLGLIPLDGHKLYIDPSNYGNPMEALMSVTEEIDRKNIKLEKLIGGGEFAEVYKGTLTCEGSNETVAVKILKPKSTQKNREDFILEASIMGQFKHPNVIGLNGVVTRSPDTPMMIITEFMDNGSLDHFLKNHDGQLTTLQLLGIARGVSAGMSYLYGMSFIHRDLAARNILVADNMAAKVADFGLSRELDDSEDNPDSEYQTQGGKIPVRWTSPEAIRYRKFSSASDVWSFGILLWEIMSFGERPYWDWDNYQVMDRVETGYRLPAPMNCPKAIHNLMLDCWDKDKSSRPKFPDIVQLIDEMIRSPEKMKHEFNYNHCINPNTYTNFDEVTSVKEWLGSINMVRYTENFANAGYMDLVCIKSLEEDDLARIGVKLIGHRNKINKSIKAMNKHFEGLVSHPEIQTLI